MRADRDLLLARLFFASAFGRQLQVFGDTGRQLHVVVGVQVGGALDERLDVVLRVRERKRSGHLQRGLFVVAAGRLLGVVLVGDCIEDLVERVVAVLEAAIVALLLADIFRLETGTGRRGIGGVEQRADAKGQEGGVEDLGRAQHEIGRAGGHVAELDSCHAAAGFVLERAELNHLLADEALVANQVELVGAGHHVVEAAVLQPLDLRDVQLAVDQAIRVAPTQHWCTVAIEFPDAVDEALDHRVVGVVARLVVVDRLAELEGVELLHGLLQRDLVAVDVGGVEMAVVGGDVVVGHGGCGDQRRDPGQGGRGDGDQLFFQRRQQVDRDTVDRLLLGTGQLDVVALVHGGQGVVFQRDDDVGLPRVQPANALRGATRRIVGRVFGDDDPVVGLVAGVVNRDAVVGVVDVAPGLGGHAPQGLVAVVLDIDAEVLAAREVGADVLEHRACRHQKVVVFARERQLGCGWSGHIGEQLNRVARLAFGVDRADQPRDGLGARRTRGLHRRVELELDDFAAVRVHVGSDLAGDLAQDVGGGELQRERQRGRAIGVQARTGLGLGLDLAERA